MKDLGGDQKPAPAALLSPSSVAEAIVSLVEQKGDADLETIVLRGN